MLLLEFVIDGHAIAVYILVLVGLTLNKDNN